MEHPSKAPIASLGHLTGKPWIDLRIFLCALSSISSSVWDNIYNSAPYSILGREILLYSCNAVMGWRQPKRVPARLSAKKEERPRLMCREALLVVDGDEDLWTCECTNRQTDKHENITSQAHTLMGACQSSKVLVPMCEKYRVFLTFDRVKWDSFPNWLTIPSFKVQRMTCMLGNRAKDCLPVMPTSTITEQWGGI